MEQIINDPTSEDITQLAKQRLFIQQTINFKYGNYSINESLNDLDYIQKIIDDRVFSVDQNYELQCLGLVLGQVICSNSKGIDWVIVEDDYGRDPALRVANTSILIFPLTLLSKRIEDGEIVDVKKIYQEVIDSIADLLKQSDVK